MQELAHVLLHESAASYSPRWALCKKGHSRERREQKGSKARPLFHQARARPDLRRAPRPLPLGHAPHLPRPTLTAAQSERIGERHREKEEPSRISNLEPLSLQRISRSSEKTAANFERSSSLSLLGHTHVTSRRANTDATDGRRVRLAPDRGRDGFRGSDQPAPASARRQEDLNHFRVI